MELAVPVFSLRTTGGIERYIWEITAQLAAKGHDVTCYAPRADRVSRPAGVSGHSVGRGREPNSIAGAWDLWRQQSEPPRDPSELVMAANLDAERGSDTALPLIERLRGYQPAEADTVLAILRLRQSKLPEAASALESAFARYRVDPWPLMRFKLKALALADELTTRDPQQARRLFDVLRQPFSVRVIDDRRLLMMVDLTTRFDFKGACREPVGALEPYVPWTAGFLVLRRDCYQANNDPRLAVATRELNDFLAHEPLPLAPAAGAHE